MVKYCNFYVCLLYTSREQYQEKVTGKDPVPDRDLDKELREAVVKNDYEKITSLKEEGYKLSLIHIYP